MFSRSIKAYFLIISLFLSIIISSNIYANTGLNLSSTTVTVYAGHSSSISWTASNGGKYRVLPKNCPSWINLSPNDANQLTGRIHIRPPVGTKAQLYSCNIQACSTVYGTCATKSLTVNVGNSIDKTVYNLHFDTNDFSKGNNVVLSSIGQSAIMSCKPGLCTAQAKTTKSIKIKLTPTLAKDYKFTRWNGIPECSTQFVCEMTVSRNMNIGMVFELINVSVEKFTLILHSESHGTIKSSPNGTSCNNDTCSKDHPKNTWVDITATPDTGYKFKVWTGACTGTGVCKVYMNENNKLVRAIFEKSSINSTEYNLTFNQSNGGSVNLLQKNNTTKISCNKNICTIKDSINKIPLRLEAVVLNKYKFSRWVGVFGCSTNPICNITVSRDMTIGVEFVPIKIVTEKFNLNVSVQGGTIYTYENFNPDKPVSGINCGSDCSAEYKKGEIVKLTVKSNDGYKFVRWEDDCRSNANGLCSLIMDSNKTVSATFEKKVVTVEDFKLSVSVEGQGSVTSFPSGINCDSYCYEEYKKGTVITLTAKPKDGYILDSWGSSCSNVKKPCLVTIADKKHMLIEFKKIPSKKVFRILPIRAKSNASKLNLKENISYGVSDYLMHNKASEIFDKNNINGYKVEYLNSIYFDDSNLKQQSLVTHNGGNAIEINIYQVAFRQSKEISDLKKKYSADAVIFFPDAPLVYRSSSGELRDDFVGIVEEIPNSVENINFSNNIFMQNRMGRLSVNDSTDGKIKGITAIHELGHLMGLEHSDGECIKMSDGTIRSTIMKHPNSCAKEQNEKPNNKKYKWLEIYSNKSKKKLLKNSPYFGKN